MEKSGDRNMAGSQELKQYQEGWSLSVGSVFLQGHCQAGFWAGDGTDVTKQASIS